MKTRYSMGFALAALLSVGAYADSYRAEVGFDYLYIDIDDSPKFDTYRLHGTYYFAPVRTGGLPLAEAAFLNRASSVQLGVHEDLDAVTVRADYFIPNTLFYLGAMAVRTDTVLGSDTDWYFSVGVTPFDGLLFSTYITDDGYDINFFAKYVTTFGAGNGLNVEAYYEEDDDFGDSWGALADYFITPRLSVGIGYSDHDGDSDISLRSRMFFTQAISGELIYTDYDWGNGVQAGIAFRF